MSIEALAAALHHSRAKGATKLVLLGIANHDGDGGSWPSILTLCKYSNANRATVQRSLTQLERLGEIDRRIQDGGDQHTRDHDRPNRYIFKIKCPRNCDGSMNHHLLCVKCGRKLAPIHQRLLEHPECPKGGGRVFDRHAAKQAPEGAAFSKTRPEPLHASPIGQLSIGVGLNRARGSETAETQTNTAGYADSGLPADAIGAASCPRWPALSGPHAYNRTGRCIDCGAHAPANTDDKADTE